MAVRRFIRGLFVTRRLYLGLASIVVLFTAAHFWPTLDGIARYLLVALGALTVLDAVVLFAPKEGLEAERPLPLRLSNGDENPLTIKVQSGYRFTARLTILEELPHQFQQRDMRYELVLPAGAENTIPYTLRPVRRGVYQFGQVRLLAASPIGLVRRRYSFGAPTDVPVYPSFLQMRKYQLLAITNRLHEAGVKRIRRLGHTMEFERIKEYVSGDDPRTVNWKATARRANLMVNQYQDERSQPVYCLIDMGRVMRLPFEEMTLLDYSINATLVLSSVALIKHDRAGLLTFSNTIHTVLPAERRRSQLSEIQERLYALQTDFLETDYERLYTHVRRHIRQRSLLLLFTNFDTRSALDRQMAYLKALARRHMLVVIFFENTELHALTESSATDTESIYIKTIAAQFAYERREMVRELARHGILGVLTPPEKLTVNTLNTYLELKARGVA